MTRATEAAAFFGITTTIYLALLFQWLPITLPETVQNFTLPVV
jgi:dolichyl-phosphate mannosyltransferase polypeptide 3